MSLALELAQEAWQRSQQENLIELSTQSRVQLAHLLTQIGRYSEACQNAKEILDDNENNTKAVDALIILGSCAAQTDNLKGAEEFLQKAADLSRKLNYMQGLAYALHNMASLVYLTRGEFNLALVVMREAAMLKEEDNIQYWGLSFLRAYIYQILGNRHEFRKALDDLLLYVKPATHIAGAYYMLWARLAMDENELEKAEEYLRLALRIANNTGIPDLNIWVRMDYSRFYRLRSEAPVALTWAEDGARFASRTGYRYLFGLALVERAQAAWQAMDIMSAEENLLEAIQVFLPFRASYDQSRATFLLAALYHEQNRPELDEKWIEAARQIITGGYAFIMERERALAFPLVASQLHSHKTQSRKMAEDLLEHLSRVPPPTLKVNGLGQFMVWQGRRLVPDQAWQRRKAGELFRYLLLRHSHSASKEELIEDIWPDHPLPANQDLFHQATSTLRRILEPDLPDKFPSRYLAVEGDRVILRFPPGSVVDFEQFEQSLPPAINARSVEKLKNVIGSYTGALFPSDQYSDWAISRRESLSELYIRGLLALGNAYLDQGNFYDALECSRRILQQDIWNEDGALLGMKSCISLRDIPRALRIFMDLERTLHNELQISPRDDIRSLANQLQQG
ncbi:MAG: BTAD domain-containing putative transcriptional regulator [Anaerolineaceae bacterium]|nr:BTAD domain-containing putative transcriptional regulator [Anaerolineaceae bacterium]